MAIYTHLKRMGVTDDRIILMLPENHACNARNPYPGQIFFETGETTAYGGRENLYCEDIEVDYKAEDLTYETILNLIRGRYEKRYPASKRLLSNERKKIFIYMNGHGGENFFKI
jgi:phosphatidylinositol glycan class K